MAGSLSIHPWIFSCGKSRQHLIQAAFSSLFNVISSLFIVSLFIQNQGSLMFKSDELLAKKAYNLPYIKDFLLTF
jgi:hypothetical protein